MKWTHPLKIQTSRPGLTQEETENWKGTISIFLNLFLINNLPIKKTQHEDGWIIQNIKGRDNMTFMQDIPETSKAWILSSLFCEACSISTKKEGKSMEKKDLRLFTHEYGSVHYLTKVLANQIHWLGLIPRMQDKCNILKSVNANHHVNNHRGKK